ncbi:unnamed protein product [Ranitomeya imitator]|uniref:Uncharacterized protein n=1 Tax=Ranitomeya imitator TaxID=111125 RepID=A0ABN9L8W4_9NEOB|nr:unnamed protein product [Ranitomeya imitator]
MELSGVQWSKLQDLCQVLQCFEECTRLVSADDAIISMSIPLMRLLMQSLMYIKEQASAAEDEGSLDDSQPLSGQGSLLDEVAGEEEEDEEDDGDEYFLDEEASQRAIETGGFASLQPAVTTDRPNRCTTSSILTDWSNPVSTAMRGCATKSICDLGNQYQNIGNVVTEVKIFCTDGGLSVHKVLLTPVIVCLLLLKMFF